MKKFNLKLHTSILLTIMLLQGCMPDSLTKFKKDTPQKTSSSSTSTPTTSTPVVDNSGTPITFNQPSLFWYGTSYEDTFNLEVSVTATVPVRLDGTLSDLNNNPFLLSCSLDKTGNSQTTDLPSGLKLGSNCSITGIPSMLKSVETPFCSDPSFTDQTSCESTKLTWNGSSCSNKDFQYRTQEKCEAAFNKWYPKGSPVPYRIKMVYKDAAGVVYTAYTTVPIGTYRKILAIEYSQSDKLAIAVNAIASSIIPTKTTTSTTGQYSSTGIITGINGVSGVVNYVNTVSNIIGVKKFLKMTLSNSTGFNAGDFISTSGNVKIGKIFKKDTLNTNIIYVENISNDEIYFVENDSIGNNKVFASRTATATILKIDESYKLSQVVSPQLDNDIQFYTSKMQLTGYANSYLANSSNDIKPLKPITGVLSNNGITFSVTPKLPEGLSLNVNTGEITGKILKAINRTTYTVTASNPISSQTAIFGLVSTDAPKNLSVNTNQILTVSNTAFFVEGEPIFQQVVPPLADAPKGTIAKILNSYQIAVETTNGPFTDNGSLDSGSGFFSEKAYVIPDRSCVNTSYTTQTDCEDAGYVWSTGSNFYNVALKLSAPTYETLGSCSDPTFTTKADCQDAYKSWSASIISTDLCSNPAYTNETDCTTNGGTWTHKAKGAIVGLFDPACSDGVSATEAICLAAAGQWGHKYILLSHLTKDSTGKDASGVSSTKTFTQGETITSSGVTINEVDSSAMKLTLNDATSFSAGSDVTSKNTLSSKVQAGGYIYKKSSNTIYVSDITRAPSQKGFVMNDTLYAGEKASGANTNIDAVSHDVSFVAERGKFIAFNTAVESLAIFSITPALPAGLTLNATTGQISGTPTTLTPRKEYTLVANNFVGQTSYVFSLEVRDYFSLTEASGAPSFILHKMGDSQINRKCRINASDIINGTGGLLDIRCMLEAEEEDLNFNPIKFQLTSGPGVCQYIQYAPYWFWQYSPKQSANTSASYPAVVTVRSGYCSSGVAPTTDYCDGNYAALGGTGPNCDEGKLKYFAQATIEDPANPGSCIDSGAPQALYVACGGKKVNCAAGPIKDLLTDTQISSGFRSVIYQSPNGVSKNWTLTAPISKGDLSNLRVSNSTINNQCSTSLSDISTWTTTVGTTASTANPFGGTTPYYTFNCLNAASQITGRIRVIVRDWDRSFKINNGIDWDNPSATNTGIASDANGTFMNNTGRDLYNYPYNNHADWDNDYTNLGSCSNPSYTSEYSCAANGGTWTSGGANYTGGSCGSLGGGTDYAYPEANL